MNEAPTVCQAVSVLKEEMAALFKEQLLMGQKARQPLLSPEGAITEPGTEGGGEGGHLTERKEMRTDRPGRSHRKGERPSECYRVRRAISAAWAGGGKKGR